MKALRGTQGRARTAVGHGQGAELPNAPRAILDAVGRKIQANEVTPAEARVAFAEMEEAFSSDLRPELSRAGQWTDLPFWNRVVYLYKGLEFFGVQAGLRSPEFISMEPRFRLLCDVDDKFGGVLEARRPAPALALPMFFNIFHTYRAPLEEAGLPTRLCADVGGEEGETLARVCGILCGAAMADLTAECRTEQVRLDAEVRIAEAEGKDASGSKAELGVVAGMIAKLQEMVTKGQRETHARLMEIQKQTDNIPSMAENFAKAMEEPVEMAAHIQELARKELSAEAALLWGEMQRNGYSINAARKKLGKPYVRMNKLFHAEVEPFLKRHGLSVKTEGRTRMLAFTDDTERKRAKAALAGYHGPNAVGEDDEDAPGG